MREVLRRYELDKGHYLTVLKPLPAAVSLGNSVGTKQTLKEKDDKKCQFQK